MTTRTWTFALVLLAGCTAPAAAHAPEPIHPLSSQATAPTPVLSPSYRPSCGRGSPGCLAGTEIQALRAFEGQLYAGTTNWMETSARVWPRTSAQVLVLDAAAGAWRALPPLPDPLQQCKPDVAPWEQVNALEPVSYVDGGETRRVLLASTMPNEDGGCPGLKGGVFYLDAAGAWVDTRLASALRSYYGKRQTETRYVIQHVGGAQHDGAECPAEAPCVFAFVGPRGPGRAAIAPTVWRGRIDPQDPSCNLICWDREPEVALDGKALPAGRRIVSAHSAGERGVFFGTALPDGQAQPRPVERAALMQRAPGGKWSTLWVGPPKGAAAVSAVRGIATVGDSLWFVTNPRGAVYRSDRGAEGFAAPVREVELVDVAPGECTKFYGYQLYIHDRGGSDPVLAVASQSCRERQGRIFYRHLEGGTSWQALELPELADDPTTRRVNEAAVRWMERSPFDDDEIFIGTTDMNSGPASLTARIYRLSHPFP